VGLLIQAERAWLGPGRVEEGWGLRIEDGIVREVGPLRRLRQGRPVGETVVDCGRSVLMPGLVNAHVHLELGWLRDRLSARGGFASWVRELGRLRLEESARLGAAAMERQTELSIRLGAQEMLHHGTTAFLDVSNTGLVAKAVPGSRGARVFAALECIGLDRSRAASILERAGEYLAEGDRGLVRTLVAAHALYSCSIPLLKGLASLGADRGPRTIHLMESREEADLFGLGMGPLRAFVDEICPENDLLSGEDPLDRLEKSGLAPGPLLAVHGYALEPRQIQRLARWGANLCLCPSSRRFFLHPPIPFAEILRHRLPVCLGTDSLASAPSLSLWREMRALKEENPGLEPGRILSWATEGGARALGLPGGRLAQGLPADWIAVESADVPSGDLEEFLVGEEPEVRYVAVGGECLIDGRWDG
jgi:cytosine/adenosine deaminase-related metal-dependent hydrolase